MSLNKFNRRVNAAILKGRIEFSEIEKVFQSFNHYLLRSTFALRLSNEKRHFARRVHSLRIRFLLDLSSWKRFVFFCWAIFRLMLRFQFEKNIFFGKDTNKKFNEPTVFFPIRSKWILSTNLRNWIYFL